MSCVAALPTRRVSPHRPWTCASLYTVFWNPRTTDPTPRPAGSAATPTWISVTVGGTGLPDHDRQGATYGGPGLVQTTSTSTGFQTALDVLEMSALSSAVEPNDPAAWATP